MNDKLKKKPVYETPLLMPLADLSEGAGANCSTGSGASPRCRNGSSATGHCTTGNTPGSNCYVGNSYSVPAVPCRIGFFPTGSCSWGFGV